MKVANQDVFHLAPPKEGMQRAVSAKTSVLLGIGKLYMECPVCTQGFYRHACHAKRVNQSFCGVGCANESKKCKVEKRCVVCDKGFMVTPTNLTRISTCSKVCQSLKRRCSVVPTRPRSTAAYARAVQQVRTRGCCARCETTIGPWIVRGIAVVIPENDVPIADAQQAELICQSCHFKEVGVKGGISRQIQRRIGKAVATV